MPLGLATCVKSDIVGYVEATLGQDVVCFDVYALWGICNE
jgi:hypothetical protein